MFLYKINTVDILLSKIKSREQVVNDPDLCKLLENPYLKDDTELAIKYQEYKKGYPDAASNFVNYFFMHGPELDTGSLLEWRDIILNDPNLSDIGNNIDISELWQEKQENQEENFSWGTLPVGETVSGTTTSSDSKNSLLSNILVGLFDCLSKPCSYLSPTSEMVGLLGDARQKYNLQNDCEVKSTGLYSWMKNRMPKAITDGMSQLIQMVSKETGDIFNGNFSAKQDPFAVSDAELIGGDILSDVAAKLGDCFRIYENNVRYQPYDYDQNLTGAPATGIARKDEDGNTHVQSPRGNPVGSDDNLSDNSRLNFGTTSDTIDDENLFIISDKFNATKVEITVYGGAVTNSGKFYGDYTVESGNDPSDKWSPLGILANSHKFVVPSASIGLSKYTETKRKGLGPYVASHGFLATRYFKSILKKHNYSLYKNIKGKKNENSSDDTILKLADKGIRCAGEGLMLRIYFPNGTVDFQVADVNGESNFNYCWADIVGQFGFTAAGNKVISITDGKGNVINTIDNCFIGSYDSLLAYPSLSAINNATRSGTIKGISIKNNNVGNSKRGRPFAMGVYYFSRNFEKASELINYAKQHNIPEDIFFEPWSFGNIGNSSDKKEESLDEQIKKILKLYNGQVDYFINLFSSSDQSTHKKKAEKFKLQKESYNKQIDDILKNGTEEQKKKARNFLIRQCTYYMENM